MDTLAQTGPMHIGPIARSVVMNAALKAGAIEQIAIRDDAHWHAMRAQDITASVIGALVDVHDYATAYSLYLEKTGLVVPEVDDRPVLSEDGEEIIIPPAMRGRLLEGAALQAVKAKHPDWQIAAANDAYFRAPASRIGCTPDAFAADPLRSGRGIIQVKTTSDLIFRQKWIGMEGAVEVPLWIACQAITEAKLTGSSWACVALLVVGATTRLRVIDVPLHDDLWKLLRAKVAEFWQRVESGEGYAPDFSRDGDRVRAIYGHDNGSEIDLSGDNRMAELVSERDRLKVIEATGNDAEKLRKALDAEIIAKLGPAQRARLADGTIIVARTITVNRKPQPASTSSHRRVTVTRATGEAA
jgi:hypothetical protein